jgi:hypothetical protein
MGESVVANLVEIKTTSKLEIGKSKAPYLKVKFSIIVAD